MVFDSSDWRVKINSHNAYDKNVTIIKKFNDNYYKLVTFNSLRIDGVELDSDFTKSKKNSVNDKKLLNNIARARNTIFELAMCNDWEYFVTLTLSPEKLDSLGLDRYNLTEFYKFFHSWIYRLPYKIKYLLVPEKHKNGAWHFHGFISGISDDDLIIFTNEMKLPRYIKNKINNNELVYSWGSYADKFGFCDLEFIKNQEKCSSYVTKYISKELYKTIDNLGMHSYYASKGLKRADRILKDKCTFDSDFDYDFSNDYVSVKILTDAELQSLCIV